MTEFGLFVIVGALAVAAAVMMLLSENAVYSALFLIVTMGCIAFLFLLLDAPFLAMIQITVYAGAIMVLFIFVIMLLGAERMGAAPGKYHWLTGAAALLSAIFLLMVGVSVSNGGIDRQRPAPANPQVRFINAITDGGDLTINVGQQAVVSNLSFRVESPFVALAAGSTPLTISLSNVGTVKRSLDLNAGETDTVVVYGRTDAVAIKKVPVDLSTPPRNSTRVTFVNTFGLVPTVNLVDLGVNGTLDVNPTSKQITDTMLLTDFKPGAVSDPMIVDAGMVNWAFIQPDGQIVYRMRDLDLKKGTSQLVVLSGESVAIGNTVRAVAEPPFVADAAPSFGGPQAIGLALFAGYLLPFELVSLLLLASMVGAIVLTHREGARVKDKTRRRVSRPLASVIAGQVGHEVVSPESDNTPRLPSEGTSPAGD